MSDPEPVVESQLDDIAYFASMFPKLTPENEYLDMSFKESYSRQAHDMDKSAIDLAKGKVRMSWVRISQ